MEITLLYPYALSIDKNSLYGLVMVLIFMVIITLGFYYEIGKDALKIDNKESHFYKRSRKPNVSDLESKIANRD